MKISKIVIAILIGCIEAVANFDIITLSYLYNAGLEIFISLLFIIYVIFDRNNNRNYEYILIILLILILINIISWIYHKDIGKYNGDIALSWAIYLCCIKSIFILLPGIVMIFIKFLLRVRTH